MTGLGLIIGTFLTLISHNHTQEGINSDINPHTSSPTLGPWPPDSTFLVKRVKTGDSERFDGKREKFNHFYQLCAETGHESRGSCLRRTDAE